MEHGLQMKPLDVGSNPDHVGLWSVMWSETVGLRTRPV